VLLLLMLLWGLQQLLPHLLLLLRLLHHVLLLACPGVMLAHLALQLRAKLLRSAAGRIGLLLLLLECRQVMLRPRTMLLQQLLSLLVVDAEHLGAAQRQHLCTQQRACG
jgi:hypothetical protein